jgi:superfamily II DNA or RNA helicase
MEKSTSIEVELRFNSAWCYLKSPLPLEVMKRLMACLSYKDKGLEFINHKYKRNIDTTRYVFDAKARAFPTGLIPRVYDMLERSSCSIKLSNEIDPVPYVPVDLPEWLYDHQRQIINTALTCYRGLIQSPTGSGKSIAIAYLLKHFPTAKIVVVVPTVDLLRQTASTLEKHLNEKIGRVGGGYKDWQRLTVGIINSLSKLASSDPPLFVDVNILVFDESHKVGPKSYQVLSNACTNALYRLGFSATNFREAGDNLLLEGIIGAHLLTIKEMDLVDCNLILKPEYLCVPIKDPGLVYPGAKQDKNGKCIYETFNGKPEKRDVYNLALVNNKERNSTVIEVLQTYLQRNSAPALVLVEWLSHGLLLQEMASKQGIDLLFIHGKTPAAERSEVIEKMRAGQYKAVCATKILNEGTDIPALGLVIIASGGTAHTRILQQVGRAIRTSSTTGKTRALVVDFKDMENFYLAGNFAARSRAIVNKFPMSIQILDLPQVKTIL